MKENANYRLAGPIIATIPVRIQSNHNLKLSGHLEKVQKNVLESINNSFVGISAIQKLIGRNPLFDTLFVYQNKQEEADFLRGLVVERINPKKNEVLEFPVVLEIEKSNEGFTAVLSSHPSFVSIKMSERITSVFGTIASRIIKLSSATVKMGGIFDTTFEYENEVLAFGKGKIAPIPEIQIEEKLIQISQLNPQLIAVIDENQTITYQDLNNQSAAISQFLLSHGVQTGQFVALICNRSANLLAGIFGILRAGCAYIPIDDSMPAERILTIINESLPSVVLFRSSTFDEDLIAKMSLTNLKTYSINEAIAFKAANILSVSRPIDANDPVFVVFTSGSTGKPKGVIVKRIGMMNYLGVIWKNEVILNERILIIGSVLSLNFDFSQSEYLGSIYHGRALLLGDPFNIAEVAKRSDYIGLTPSLLRHLPKSSEYRIQVMDVGGEPLALTLANEWSSKVHMTNSYGPSEITVASSFKKIKKFTEKITVGKPSSNTLQYIVDKQLRLVPVGVAGELIIGGVGVAAGYLHREDLTSERFLPNHFTNDGSKFYMTGDVCRWTESGEIDMMGRADDMVKVNGYRIELNEVRDHLEFVENAEVLKIDHQLVAFVTPSDCDVNQIRDALEKKLPRYMIPSLYICLDRLPLTSNGKVYLVC